jgi:hypothetical protein
MPAQQCLQRTGNHRATITHGTLHRRPPLQSYHNIYKQLHREQYYQRRRVRQTQAIGHFFP